MKVPKKKKIVKSERGSLPRVKVTPKKREHQKYGTSKLEDDFAHDFLDKLGVKYERQFEAKDIGRFYDFYINDSNLLIEIDGGFYHSDPRLVKEEKMNNMQKHNKWVDKKKDEWALLHGIPIMRIWEKDIRENPKAVMKELKERLYVEDEKIKKINEKNKRHINKIK